MTLAIPDQDFSPPSLTGLDGAGVLVVDSDPAFLLALKTFLAEYVGFEKVLTANTGEEALTLFETEPSIQVIVIDAQGPRLSGIEAVETLSRRLDRLVAVIMVASDPNAEVKRRFRACRSTKLLPFRFLPKPVEFERLESLILEAHRELRAIRRLATGPESLPDEETAPIMPIVPPPASTPDSESGDSASGTDTQPVQPVSPAPVPFPSDPPAPGAIDARLDEITARLDALDASVQRLPRRRGFLSVTFGFLFRLVEIALGLGLIWVAVEMGWLSAALSFLQDFAASLPIGTDS